MTALPALKVRETKFCVPLVEVLKFIGHQSLLLKEKESRWYLGNR